MTSGTDGHDSRYYQVDEYAEVLKARAMWQAFCDVLALADRVVAYATVIVADTRELGLEELNDAVERHNMWQDVRGK